MLIKKLFHIGLFNFKYHWKAQVDGQHSVNFECKYWYSPTYSQTSDTLTEV